jgi:hypothetical protein
MSCGGQSAAGDGDDTGGARARGGSGGSTPSATGGRAGDPGTGGRAKSDFVDPECPTVPAPAGMRECEPFGDGTDCPLGFACYPYVEHPFGEGCDAQSFGTRCRQAGSGIQGDVCGPGTNGCAAGHLCVIGLQSGRRCARICTFDGRTDCDQGMICGETDVDGYGVCS